MRIVDNVREIIKTPIEEMGYELYDIDFLKEAEGYVLTIYIDSEKGITLDDCEKVSRAIDPILDEHDPIKQAYYLSVSSVGIDRPLKIERDYERNVGNLLDIKTYAAVNGKKQFVARLTAYDDTTMTVEDPKSGKQTVIERKAVALARPHIDF